MILDIADPVRYPAEMETEAGSVVISQMKAAMSRVSHYLGFETETAALVS